MKKYSWLYPTSLFTRCLSVSLCTTLCMRWLAGCYMSSGHVPPEPQSSAHFLPQVFRSTPPPPIRLEYQGALLGEIPPTSCMPSSHDRSLILPLVTTMGSYTSTWTAVEPPSQELSSPKTWLVTVGSTSFYVPRDEDLVVPQLERICSEWQSTGQGRAATFVVTDTPLATELTKLLTQWVPDCEKISMGRAGWGCQLNTMPADEAAARLNRLHGSVLLKWQRVPYSFSRRLATARRLANDLNQGEMAMHGFCKMLEHTLPAELPYSFGSAPWQQALCPSGLEGTAAGSQQAAVWSPEQVALAAHGLGKAVEEMEFIDRLSHETSKVGSLSIRIPKEQAPTKDLWVRLEPSKEVNTETWGALSLVWQGPDPGGACWHPLFEANATLLAQAHMMQLTGKASHQTCPTSEETEGLHTAALTQLTQLLLAEAAFVVSNGSIRTLRLPKGRYQYTLLSMDGYIPHWETGQPQTSSMGEIQWEKKKPDPVISQW